MLSLLQDFVNSLPLTKVRISKYGTYKKIFTNLRTLYTSMKNIRVILAINSIEYRKSDFK
jgi:hypothetical protein